MIFPTFYYLQTTYVQVYLWVQNGDCPSTGEGGCGFAGLPARHAVELYQFTSSPVMTGPRLPSALPAGRVIKLLELMLPMSALHPVTCA